MRQLYTPGQVETIQRAYRALFPFITPGLADYWGFSRSRSWSCLTSDFHATSYQQLHALHEATLAIDAACEGDLDARGAALREAARRAGIGFSVGVCPWTDHLLLETFREDQSEITLLIGHDWYPIVLAGRASGSPLDASDNLRGVERYWPAAPQAVFNAATVGLFVNLYPDYRPPGEPKCGALTRYGYSYAQCLQGMDELVAALAQRYRTIKVISWGTPVWNALLPRVRHAGKDMLLSAHIAANSGTVQSVELGGKALAFLPIYHPSHWGNFGRRAHLDHVRRGFSELELGLPGPDGAASRRVQLARAVPG